MRKRSMGLAGAMALCPNLAFAHGVGAAGGFLAGLTHPVLGFDHLLAMVSVGILSAQMGGRAIWTVPTTFVLVMLLGGILGIWNIAIVSVELGIACSVLALGVVIAAGKKMPSFLAMFFVGFFAIFHGHAHGTEMPNLAKPAFYAFGFVVGTAGIHIAGVVMGLLAERFTYGGRLLRVSGAAIACIGLYLVAV